MGRLGCWAAVPGLIATSCSWSMTAVPVGWKPGQPTACSDSRASPVADTVLAVLSGLVGGGAVLLLAGKARAGPEFKDLNAVFGGLALGVSLSGIIAFTISAKHGY